MKKMILLYTIMSIGLLSLHAKHQTHISAEIMGLEGEVVFFDFLEKTGINMEFPYVNGQKMEFSVALDDITMMRVNSFIHVCLQPGDSIHIKVVYEGKFPTRIEYSGTTAAVAVNEALYKMRQSQQACRYKKDIPAALVTMVDAKGYHTATLEEWEAEIACLDAVKNAISPRVYNYILSDLDGTFLTNLITYPYASSEFHKKDIEACLASDYWDVLNDYRLRDDEASLRNRSYMSFLSIYMNYINRKKAGGNTAPYRPLGDIEKEYHDLTAFYEGTLRDAALFVHLYNAIVRGLDFDVIERLNKDYMRKYNKNLEYKTTLTQILK